MKGFRASLAAWVGVIFVLVLLGAASWLFYVRYYEARPYGPGWEGMPMGPGMFWGGGMWIFPLIGLVIFLFMVYFMFTRGFGGGGPFCGWGGRDGGKPGEQSPLDVLKMRYAKGEITREEFERIRKDIAEEGGRQDRQESGR